MGACGKDAVAEMDKEAFGDHIHGLAVQLRDLVAEKAAETVHTDATTMQNNAQGLANQKEYERAEAENREANYPAPLGPDHGYSLFEEGEGEAKKIIDDYRTNYQINLLTFNSSDKEDAKGRLETELNYIVEKFDRAKELADPSADAYEDTLGTLNDLAGNGELADINFHPDSNDAVTVQETAKSGQGAFGDPAFSHIGGIMDSTQEGFDSATGQSFSKQFLPRVPPAADNQKAAVRTIRNLLGTNQEVLRWARDDIDHLVHDGIDAVEHFDDCKNGDDSTSTVLGLLGGAATIVGGIAAIPVSGGMSAAAVASGATIVAGTLSTAQNLSGAEKNKEHNFEGSDLDEITKDIMDKVDQTFEKLTEVNEALENDGFNRVANCITSGKYANGGDESDFAGSRANFAPPIPNDSFMDSNQDNVRETVDDEG